MNHQFSLVHSSLNNFKNKFSSPNKKTKISKIFKMVSTKYIFNVVFVVALLIVAVFSSPVPNESFETEVGPSNREGRFYGTGFGAANANAFASAGATGLGMGYPGMGIGSANAVASANAGATGFGYGK